MVISNIFRGDLIVAKDSSNNVVYKLFTTSDGKFNFTGPGVNLSSSGTGNGVSAINTWYHLEITRSGDKYNLYANGNHVANGSSTVSIGGVSSLTLGSPEGIIGNIDDVRILKGSALHNTTSSFTPPVNAHSAPSATTIFSIETLNNKVFEVGTNTTSINKGDSSVSIYDTEILNDSNISFKVNNVERMKVGTSNTEVNGDMKITSGNLNLGTTSTNNIILNSDGTGYISNRLGIGITNPDSALHLAGAGENAGIIHIGKEYSTTPTAPSSGDGGILYVKNDGQLYYSSNTIAEKSLVIESDKIVKGDSQVKVTDTGSDADISFKINSADKMIINNTGVGIGTTTPRVDLDVNGTVIASSVGIGITNPTEKLEVVGAIKVADSVSSTADNGVIKYASNDFWGRKGNEWISLTGGATNSKSEFTNKKARFSNDKVTITSIPNNSKVITVSDASNFSVNSIIYITGTGASTLDERYHTITNKSGNDITIGTESNATVSSGNVHLNYTNYTPTMISNNKEIVLLPLSHSLGTGDHHIYITWTTKFNENPLDDQILKIYYKDTPFISPPPPGTTITANSEGTLLSTIFLSNAVGDSNTTSSTVFVRVPGNSTYYLRWTRSSAKQYRWGTGVGEISLDDFNVNYVTPSTASSLTDRIYQNSSIINVVDNGSMGIFLLNLMVQKR